MLGATFDTWARQYPEAKFLLIGSAYHSDGGTQYIDYLLTTCKDEIWSKITERNNSMVVVVSTYQSSWLIKDIFAPSTYKPVFDLVIYDEAHHTVGEYGNSFNVLLLCPDLYDKCLFMTATPRIRNSKPSDSRPHSVNV